MTSFQMYVLNLFFVPLLLSFRFFFAVACADDAPDSDEGALADVDEDASSTGVRTRAAGARERGRRVRTHVSGSTLESQSAMALTSADLKRAQRRRYESWRRTLLLALAVTIHNIPVRLCGM